MKVSRIFLLLIGLALHHHCFCLEGSNRFYHTQDSIPFILTDHNNIIIKATLNSSDSLDLMLHTAASSLSIIKEVADSINSIAWNQEDKVESWGGQNSARYSSSNTLKIDDLEWSALELWDCMHSGPQSDGKFGLDLFEDKVIEFNFDLNLLVLHDSIPVTAEKYEQLKLEHDNGFMFISVNSMHQDSAYTNKYLIHSGYAGFILYNDEFAAACKFGEKLEVLKEKALKDSFGNTIKVKKAKMPSFEIGSFTFKDLPVGFFEGAVGRQKMSAMDGDVLKRFNIIIDAKKEYIYLKANKNFGIPYSTV